MTAVPHYSFTFQWCGEESGYQAADQGREAMKPKRIEGRMRAANEALDLNISDQDFIYQLNSLGVDVARTRTEDPLGPFEFKAKSQRLAEACSVAFLLGRFMGRREIVDVTLTDIDVENREQSIRHKKTADLGGATSRLLAMQRHTEILNAYAAWAAKPNSVRLTNTAFAIRLSTQKKREGTRGFGKSIVAKVISDFDSRVVRSWQALRTSGADRSSAVVARITDQMAGQPGVNRDTVRRAIGP